MIFYQSAIYYELRGFIDDLEPTFSFHQLFPFDIILNTNKGVISEKKFTEFAHVVTEFKRKFPEALLMLDCGAFTAYRAGFEIDVMEYIKFIHSHSDWFDYVVALDRINDPEGTWKNYEIMRANGVNNAMPVYHVGEPDDVLKRLVDESEYVGFSPPIGLDGQSCIDVYHNALYSKDGSIRFPDTKFHGFGVGTPTFFQVYPWHSCDASNASLAARFGQVCIINNRGGQLELSKFPVSSIQQKDPKHYIHLPAPARAKADELFESFGYTITDFDENSYSEEENGEALHQRILFSIEMFNWAVDQINSGKTSLITPIPRLF